MALPPYDRQRLKEVFAGARALPVERRPAYLAEACGGNEALRQEVESLLASDEFARSFLETPAAVQVQDAFAGTNLEGQRIGSHQIEARIGAGGMGEVYRALDTKLNRQVAIKFLLPAVADDPDRLARFSREAQVLASLNHPHIAQIHGLEDASGVRALVMELVDGPTLADRIAQGAIPVDEALAMARQIAEALEAAHRQGIIHRDLKPANIKIREDGTVKVLDFGLAKALDPTTRASVDEKTPPTPGARPTEAGVILGTAAYMSPEQARGRPVDKRADIWAFGVVLYEMLTGRAAFAGDTITDIIAAVVTREPDWTAVPATTPGSIRRLLARCLEKDPKRRLRDIGDARIEIEELQGGRVSGSSSMRAVAGPAASAPSPRASRMTPVLGAALLLLGVVAGGLAWRQLAPPPAQPPYRFTISGQAGSELDPDPASNTISPDGRTLAFVASDSAGRISIWVRPLGGYEARPLPNTLQGALPFWSPDSRQVGFFADGKLKRIGLDANAPEVICDASSGRGGSWNRNGVIVFCPASGGPLYQVRAAGGTPTAVTALDSTHKETAHRWPCFLPDGEHFLYVALPFINGQYTTYVGSLRSMNRKAVFSAFGAPVYAAPGYLIFRRGDAIVAQRFDPRSFRLSGDPFTLGDPPGVTFMSASPCLSVSNNGVLAWTSSGKPDTRLVWTDRNGREAGTVDIPLDRWSTLALSPDGRHAALGRQLPTGNDDIWTVDLERQIANRLTFGEHKSALTGWSADGRYVYFGSNARGPRDVHRKAADGSGSEEVVLESNVPFKDECDCSPDGKSIVIQQTGGPDGWNLFVMPVGGGELRPYLVTPFDELNGVVSPDGKWMLYQSNESGTQQTYVQSFPTPGSRQQVTKTGSFFALWSRKSNEIFVLRPDLTLVSVPVQMGQDLRIGSPRELFHQPSSWFGWFPSPDGQRFLVLRQAVASTPGISIAVNWRAGRRE